MLVAIEGQGAEGDSEVERDLDQGLLVPLFDDHDVAADRAPVAADLEVVAAGLRSGDSRKQDDQEQREDNPGHPVKIRQTPAIGSLT